MGFDKRISLDPRLSLVAEMLGECVCCADIGSNHGRLGAYLLQNNRCQRVLLTDISAASLERAREIIALTGMRSRVRFCVGDGAQAIDEPVDAAVIAGMGGETIARILEMSEGRLDGAKIVVQPNVAAEEMRIRLTKAGWRIADEALAKDGRRIYPVLRVERGRRELSETEALVGPVLLNKKPPLLREYAEFHLRVDRKALAGAQSGGNTTQIRELERRIAIWEDVLQCL